MLNLGQHSVECQRKLAYLGSGITFRNPAIQLSPGDRGGGVFDFRQRSEAAVHHHEAGDPDHEQDRYPDADLQPDQGADGVLDSDRSIATVVMPFGPRTETARH